MKRPNIRWGPTQMRSRKGRWLLLLVVVIGLAGWLAYDNIGPIRFLSPPVSALSSTPGPGEWAMGQRGPDRNAFVDTQFATPRGEIKWIFRTNAPMYSAPVVVDGTVYLGTGDRRIVAIDAASGDVQWEHAVTEPVKSTPAVAGDSVFVGLQDARVIALDKETGELRWQFETGRLILSSPVVYEGVVYIGSNDWRLYALDAVTGRPRWSFKADNVIWAAPAVHPPALAFNDIHGKLYILDSDTGKRRFDYITFASAKGGPVFNGERVYIADARGLVWAVDWTQREFPLEKTLLWVRFQLWHFGLVDSPGQQKGFVWAFRQKDGKFVTTPAVAWGKVYAASLSGSLFALDRETGTKVWEFKADAPFEAPPTIVGDVVLIGDTSGRLYAIDAVTGEKQWDVSIDSPITSTPVVADGVLYLTSLDGTLYALE